MYLTHSLYIFHLFSKFIVADVDRDHRFNLFRTEATEIIITVNRPNQPIFDQGRALLNCLIEKHRMAGDVLRRHDSLCFSTEVCKPKPILEKSSPVWEAACGRAVVRYLATQWYGRDLWFELLERKDFEEREQASAATAFHDKCVSLARLDLMMDSFLNKQNGSNSNEASSYYGFMVDSERLLWAPEDAEKSPLELLCSGAQRLLDRMDNDAMKEAFLTDFVRLFCAWCLSPSHSDKTMTTQGPYLHALHAPLPFDKGYHCQRCLVQETRFQSGSWCSVCNKLHRQKDKLKEFSEAEASKLLFASKRRYEKRASLVGKVLLLLPGDERMTKLATDLKRFNIIVEHHDRPVELLVASYFPRYLCRTESDNDDEEDVYHVLPLIYSDQVDFLAKLGKPRKIEPTLSAEAMDRWGTDGLLDLGGVLKMSYGEVADLMTLTNKLFDAAKNEVTRLASDCTEPSEGDHLESLVEHHSTFIPVTSGFTQSLDNEGLRRPSTNEKLLVLDDTCYGHNPVFEELLRRSGSLHVPIPTQEHDLVLEKVRRCVPPLRGNKEFTPECFLATLRIDKKHDCAVAYSDLYFQTEAERDTFMKKSPVLTDTFPNHIESTITLSMSRRPQIEAPELSGWGMELYRWKCGEQDVITVGRILDSGAAYISGLRAGDRIVELNGLSVDVLNSPVSLGCALLGLPFLADVSHSPREALTAYQLKLSAVQGLDVCVLQAKIRRMSVAVRQQQREVSHQQQQQHLHQPLPFASPQRNQRLPEGPEVIDLVSDDIEETVNESGPQIFPSEMDIFLGRYSHNRIVMAKKPHNNYSNILKSISHTFSQNPNVTLLARKIYGLITPHGRFLITDFTHTQTPTWRLATEAEASAALIFFINEMKKKWTEHQQRRQEAATHAPTTPQNYVRQSPQREIQTSRQHESRIQNSTQHPTHPVAYAPIRQVRDTEMESFVNAIGSLYKFGGAPPLDYCDLDKPGPVPLILTQAETSLLLTSMNRKQVLLGMRLLLPRYSITVVIDQVQSLRSVHVERVKILPFHAWEVFQRIDYYRTHQERQDAPVIFIDSQNCTLHRCRPT